MKSSPLVSVVIPSYNHENFVKESIQSVIDQTYQNIELIIIDDGSPDMSVKEIKDMFDSCKKRFVRFEFRHRCNKGLTATLNEALEWCQGEYFSTTASDDVLVNNKFEILVKLFSELDESYAVVFGDAEFIDENSDLIRLNNNGEPVIHEREETFSTFLDFYANDNSFDYRDQSFGSYKTLLEGNYLPAMSFLVKTKIIKDVGAWTNGNTLEDWELWLKISKNHKFFYVDVPVALYRWHSSNSVNLRSQKLHYDTLRLLKKEKKYALQNNYEKIYYQAFVKNILERRLYSKKDFCTEVLKNVYDYKFILLVMQRWILSILRNHK